MLKVTVRPVHDASALETIWREMETRAELSFFQSWTWMGCLYDARFSDPVLLRAERDGTVVALGLFNRGRLALHLGESGDHVRDSIYIEHNGLLLARRGAPDPAELLRAARRPGLLPRRLALNGVNEAHLLAARTAGGRVVMRRTHVAPLLDLTLAGRDWMARVSANTRQQLRRSSRAYGDVDLRRAGSVSEAHAFLDALAALHQASWNRRGQPGAFAMPFFREFHRALIARGLPRDEIDLLRISAGDVVIGYLYNFRHRGRVLAYQSGFDYATAHGAQKPGLTCHQAAIDMYAASGIAVYDFLAGDHRYKRSLANAEQKLYWLTLYPSLASMLRR